LSIPVQLLHLILISLLEEKERRESKQNFVISCSGISFDTRKKEMW